MNDATKTAREAAIAPVVDPDALRKRQMASDRLRLGRLRAERHAAKREPDRFIAPAPAGVPPWLWDIANRAGRKLPKAWRADLRRVLQLAYWTLTLQLAKRYGQWRANARRGAGAQRQVWPLDIARDRPLCLIVDHRLPRPDEDSGSIDVINMLAMLDRAGFHVVYACDTAFPGDAAYRDALRALGVDCLDVSDAGLVETTIADLGSRVELCILSRVYGGGRYLPVVSRCCRRARIVYNTVDLHHVREERAARLRDDAAALARAERTRRDELLLVEECDATIVVSEAEAAILSEQAPGANVVVLPLSRGHHGPVAAFETRRGIGFVGGFAHTPNVDAVEHFLDAVWPTVRKQLPDTDFLIVGADLPQRLLKRSGQMGIRYLGHVDDLEAWLNSICLTVAPLRIGAGAKGKVASSLAAGVPCVATPIAAEGMRLQNGRDIMIADEPEAFANAVVEVYRSDVTWATLSQGARLRAELERARSDAAFATLLAALGVLTDSMDPAQDRPALGELTQS